MKRWTREELAAEKARLEALAPDQMTLDDHMAVVDYLAHRYLGEDDPRTEVEWRASRAKIRERVKAAMDIPEDDGASEPIWQGENRRREERRQVLLNSYTMGAQDFRKVVCPTLQETHLALADEDVEAFLAATGSNYSEASDGRDSLIGRYHPTTWEFAQNIRENYELLRRAKNAGYEKVRISMRSTCRCLRFMDGATARIQDLLDAYEGKSARLPMLPPAQTPCLTLESPRFCRIGLTPVEQSTRSVDSDFSAWMDQVLGRSEVDIPSDWRERLAAAHRELGGEAALREEATYGAPQGESSRA
jgi:hypothetical protein